MATTTPTEARDRAGGSSPESIPPLRNGDRLTGAEFERRFDAMPHLKKAELIEGVVYVGSPVSDDHAGPHFDLITWLGLYRIATPGVVGRNDPTVRLDLDNRPQPDAYLRVLETHGGQSRLGEDRYLAGAPELVAEVAYSSVSYDLNDKREIYLRNGAREYIAWRVEDSSIDWFVSRDGRYELLPRTTEGHYRSEVFPGLWLDPSALMREDMPTVAEVAYRGLASPEHAAFVERLRRAAGGEGPR